MALAATVLDVSAQITTGNIVGTVKDSQGGVVPGATVMLIDEARGTKLAPATTDETGTYVFPNVTAATYTVEVTMSGFKTAQRKGLPVSGGDRVSAPASRSKSAARPKRSPSSPSRRSCRRRAASDRSPSRASRSRTCRSTTATSPA